MHMCSNKTEYLRKSVRQIDTSLKVDVKEDSISDICIKQRRLIFLDTSDL